VCPANVKQLEDILAEALPSEKDLTLSRRIKALASLAHDKTVQHITLNSIPMWACWHIINLMDDFPCLVVQGTRTNYDRGMPCRRIS
jgi:hypothetical protein